jgi:hypothetical protein
VETRKKFAAIGTASLLGLVLLYNGFKPNQQQASEPQRATTTYAIPAPEPPKKESKLEHICKDNCGAKLGPVLVRAFHQEKIVYDGSMRLNPKEKCDRFVEPKKPLPCLEREGDMIVYNISDLKQSHIKEGYKVDFTFAKKTPKAIREILKDGMIEYSELKRLPADSNGVHSMQGHFYKVIRDKDGKICSSVGIKYDIKTCPPKVIIPPPVTIIPASPPPTTYTPPITPQPIPPVPPVIPPPTVTLNKEVINNDGRNKKVKDFAPYTIDGKQIELGKPITLEPGEHVIKEKNRYGYKATIEGAKDGKFTVKPGDNVNITLRNDDLPLRSTIVSGLFGKNILRLDTTLPHQSVFCPNYDCDPQFLQRFKDTRYAGQIEHSTRNLQITGNYTHATGKATVQSNGYGNLEDRFAPKLSTNTLSGDLKFNFTKWKLKPALNAGVDYVRATVEDIKNKSYNLWERYIGGGMATGNYTGSHAGIFGGVSNFDLPFLFPSPSTNARDNISSNLTSPFVRGFGKLSLFNDHVNLTGDGSWYAPANGSFEQHKLRMDKRVKATGGIQGWILPEGRFNTGPKAEYLYHRFNTDVPDFGKFTYRNSGWQVGWSFRW